MCFPCGCVSHVLMCTCLVSVTIVCDHVAIFWSGEESAASELHSETDVAVFSLRTMAMFGANRRRKLLL